MSNTILNHCACPSPEIVAIPGLPGSGGGGSGTAGTNGVNAFTITGGSGSVTIPASAGLSQTFPVLNASWMAVGQVLLVGGGASQGTFQVTAVNTTSNPNNFTGTFKNQTGDVPSSSIAPGSSVVVAGFSGPAGSNGTNGFTVLGTNNSATGGTQALTATPAQALSMTLTLAASAAKTYLLSCRLRLDYVGATLASNQTVTLTLRRTNNTAANISSSTLMTEVIPNLDIQYYLISTLTKSLGELGVYTFPYTTVGVGDVIQPFISISVIPSAGSVNVVEASISAVEIT